MDQICEKVYIGNYLDALAPEKLAAAGIRSVLSLDGTLEGADYAEHDIVEIVAIKLIDGSGNRPEVFLRAVRELGRLAREFSPVLVHCHAGQSRSAIVTARFYMDFEELSLAEAMERISESRDIKVTAGLQEALDF